MPFLANLKERIRKKRLDEYVHKTALTEQEKLKYKALKTAHDEKEALRKKKQELRDYRKKIRELRYKKVKSFWKLIASILFLASIVIIYLYILA